MSSHKVRRSRFPRPGACADARDNFQRIGRFDRRRTARMGGAGVVEQPFSGFAQLGSRWTAGTQGAEQPTAADLTRNQIRRSPNRTRAPDGAPRPSCGSRSRSSPHGTADGAITCSTREKHPPTQAKKCSDSSPQVAEHHQQRVPPSPRRRECPEVHLNRTDVPVRLSKSSFGATGT